MKFKSIFTSCLFVVSFVASAQANTELSWPDPVSAAWMGGSVPSVQALAEVVPGLNKDQLRSLIGVPHFNTPLNSALQWDYLFKIGGKPCQMQVHFDEQINVVKTFWKSQNCMDFSQLVSPKEAFADKVSAVTAVVTSPLTATQNSEAAPSLRLSKELAWKPFVVSPNASDSK